MKTPGMKATERIPPVRAESRRNLRVNMISLGCPKNLVDSEMILGSLGAQGMVITSEADDADIIVVNTCGFVDSAKEESINTILEACELKKESETPKKVVVTGCLGQRYGAELRKEIPELDAIVGLGEYQDLAATLIHLADRDELDGAPSEIHYQVSDPTKACSAEVGRFRLTPSHYAYIRMSEGCDNPCTFCSIPAIRGRFRSKTIPMLVEEARELAASGATEIVLISQDTTSYGIDLDGKFQLARLLESLAEVEGVEWIRILYAYPAFMTDEMIDHARSGIEKLGLKNVEIKKGTAEDIPVEDNSVDVVITNGVLNLTADKIKAFSEIARILKPGARLQYSDIIMEGILSEGAQRNIDLWTG